MLRSASVLYLTLALLLTLAACDTVGPEPMEPPRELTTQEQQLAASSGDFGLELFRAVNEDDADGNVFISPLSVSMVESLPPTVRVDRPFAFAIRENHSGTTLFLGKVLEP